MNFNPQTGLRMNSRIYLNNHNANVTLRVSDVGRILSVAIRTNSETPNATLNELVRDSYGTVLSNHNFQREILSTFKPATTGDLTISNDGPSSVTYSIFGYIPVIGEDKEVNLNPVGGIITGVILAIIGIITLIVGIVIIILDRKGAKPKSSVKK
jgi:hypothetical protein